MEDVLHGGMQYISLGNRFEAGRMALELDWTDREAIHRQQRSLTDMTFIGRLVYDAGNWNVFLKGGYDVNDALNASPDGVAFDYNYPAFPLGNRDLHVHFFLMTDNLQKALCTQAGLTWRFHIIDKP